MEEKNVLISPVVLFLGHIQLTYFSRWSEVEDSCDSDAIERMYCAPGESRLLNVSLAKVVPQLSFLYPSCIFTSH